MQLFRADATKFKKKIKSFLPTKTYEKPHKKLHTLRPNFFLSIAKQPKTSPNLIFCLIKFAQRGTFV